MAFDQGIDFRSTAGFVTDPTNCDAETATTANYPRTSAQGNTVGWEDAPSGTRNRTSTVDARLAGIAFVANGASPKRYRIDLPSAGWYQVTLALGDNTTGQSLSAEVFDGSTLVSNVIRQGLTVSAGTFFDACGVRRTSAADWVSNEVSFLVNFSSTICRLRLGNGGSGNSPVAHFRVTAASAPSASYGGVDFRGSYQFVTDPAGSSGEINTVADYPHITAQGLTVGWEQQASSTQDRSSGVDARLAGVHSVLNSIVSKFRIDLPATGDYFVALALGDATVAQTQTVELFDGTTSLGVVVSNGATSGGQFYDASGVLRTSAALWVSNQVEVRKTFATTILRVALGANGATSGSSTIAHVHVSAVLSKQQTAKARVQNTVTKAQTAKARISSVPTKQTTAKARIQNNAVTKTQTAKARVQRTFTKTQTALARVQKVFTKAQTSIARVQNNSKTKAQTAKARIQNTAVTKTQTAKARVQNTVTKAQTSTAHVGSSSFTGTKTQTAVARLGTNSVFTLTASGKLLTAADDAAFWPLLIYADPGRLDVKADAPTVLFYGRPPSGALLLAADAPGILVTSPANTGVLLVRGDPPTVLAGLRLGQSGALRTATDPPTVYPARLASGAILLRGDPPTVAPAAGVGGRLLLASGTPVVYPLALASGRIVLAGDPATLGHANIILHASGILRLRSDVPVVTPLTPPPPPPPPPPPGGNLHIAASV